MTEFSFPWGCDPTGDGGSGSYSLDIVEETNKFLNNYDPVLEGVIHWTQAPYTGDLAATNPAGNTVRIATGIGMVEGWLYENDANVDFNVAGGNANATDLIVLRRSNPGVLPQTVRLALVRGPAAGIATVTQTASVWEVALWEVVLDAAGNFSSLNDVREYINARVWKDFAPAIDGYDFTGGNPVQRLDNGVDCVDAVQTFVYGGWKVPENFISGLLITPVVGRVVFGVAGNVDNDNRAYLRACGQAYNTHTYSLVNIITAIAGGDVNIQKCITDLTLSAVAAALNDYVDLRYARDATSINDTFTGGILQVMGWEMEYLGYKR